MRRTKADAADTRAAILSAAEEMFFEQGVSDTSLEDIAKAAGVTRGAVYWHFANKTDLFLELYNATQLPRLNILDVEEANARGLDPLAYIEALARDSLKSLSQDMSRQRMLAILLRTNFKGGMQRVQDAVDAQEAEQMEALLAVLARAENLGLLHERWSAQSVATSIWWLMKGLCWEWLLTEMKFDLVEVGDETVACLFSSFRCDR